MKKFLFIIVSLMILCVSCIKENRVETHSTDNRIELIGKYKSQNGPVLYLYQIDGCQYVMSNYGGVTHLNTCPNHKNSDIQDFSGINTNGDSDYGV